jgi:hypothetical protein
MARVWKSVGAVAVYSRWKVALLTTLAIALLAGGGFAIGYFVAPTDEGEGNPVPAVRATQEADASPPPADAAAGAPEAGEAGTGALRRERRRGYRQGYRAGTRQVFGGIEELDIGATYMIKVEGGSGEAKRTIGPRVQVREGYVYRLCRNGTHICETPLSPRSSSPRSGSAGSDTAPLGHRGPTGSAEPAG